MTKHFITLKLMKVRLDFFENESGREGYSKTEIL